MGKPIPRLGTKTIQFTQSRKRKVKKNLRSVQWGKNLAAYLKPLWLFCLSIKEHTVYMYKSKQV